jgi:hypothetical protein
MDDFRCRSCSIRECEPYAPNEAAKICAGSTESRLPAPSRSLPNHAKGRPRAQYVIPFNIRSEFGFPLAERQGDLKTSSDNSGT